MTIDKKTGSAGIVAIIMTIVTAICASGLFN